MWQYSEQRKLKYSTVKKRISKTPIGAPLKWAGGKSQVLAKLEKYSPHRGKAKRLIEPFVGSGVVFANFEFDEYLLGDSNPDLIAVYKALKENPNSFIKDSEAMFRPENNTKDNYLNVRLRFNQSTCDYERALLFLWMNRHGYQGLCRYSKKSGFNVPFGYYKKPYFPKDEMLHFSNKLQRAELVVGSFEECINQANEFDVVYSDPPYFPLSLTSNFTEYSGTSFTTEDQIRLVEYSMAAKSRGALCIISNHKTNESLKVYSEASKIQGIRVSRQINSKKATRKYAPELIAIYE